MRHFHFVFMTFIVSTGRVSRLQKHARSCSSSIPHSARCPALLRRAGRVLRGSAEEPPRRSTAANNTTSASSNGPARRPSSGATPKRRASVQGDARFRYVAGNQGPDIWLIFSLLLFTLPIVFIAWAFKTGLVDPSRY